MNLDDFISSRKFSTNKNKDFGFNKQFAIKNIIIDEPDELLSKLFSYPDCNAKNRDELSRKFEKRTDFYFDSDDGYIINPDFRIITRSDVEGRGKKGVIKLYRNKSCVLIYPFFYTIYFLRSFNIFVCSKQMKDNPFRYRLYYFDIKGRFIYEESNKYLNNGLPAVGYNTISNSVEKITPLPENVRLIRTFDFNTYQVDKDGQYGIINIKGNWIIEPEYDEIYYWKNKEFAIVSKKSTFFSFHIKSKILKKLDYNVFDCKRDALRIMIDNARSSKMGMINNDLKIIHTPTYDYMHYCRTLNRNIVFVGEHKDEHIDSEGTKWDDYSYYFRKLNLGKCGLIDINGVEVIPIKFDYIKEISRNKFIVNIGCEVIEIEYDKRNIYRTVNGGSWKEYDLDGNFIRDISIEEAEKLNQEFRDAEDLEISIE